MQQGGAKEKKPVGTQFKKNPRKGYPRGYRCFNMCLRQSYMH